MFGKDKYSKVTRTKETRYENGSVSDLAGCEDTTAVQALYIYKRSNYSQQSFLNSVLSPYIKVKIKVQVTDSLSWDYADEKVLSREVETFNPPYDIRERISNLYHETLNRGCITNEEKEELEKQRKLDNGFNNFFN